MPNQFFCSSGLFLIWELEKETQRQMPKGRRGKENRLVCVFDFAYHTIEFNAEFEAKIGELIFSYKIEVQMARVRHQEGRKWLKPLLGNDAKHFTH